VKFIAIVGSSGSKLTKIGETHARKYIQQLISSEEKKHGEITIVSGGCPYGGVDAIAEGTAKQLGVPILIFKPKALNWSDPSGFKARNIQIAKQSDIVHVVVVNQLPQPDTEGNYCYHCHSKGHVPSGGCWTGKYAEQLGKETKWHVIDNQKGLTNK